MRPYLRVANVYEDRIDLRDVMEMHFEPREVERFELKPGDILLNEGQSRELVGRPAMYRDELPGACFTNSLVRFQPFDVVENKFALALFRHWLKNGAFQSIAQITTNIAHLGAGRFADMDFPLPPLKEQRRIVAKLEALQARSRRAREALDAVPPLLEKLRRSILESAFRGDLTTEWRAKNKSVEPASKLLERIRVERRRKWEEAELAKLKTKGKVPTDDKWKAKYRPPKPVDATELPALPEGWCWASLELVTTRVTDGTHQPPPTTPSGIPFIGIRNVIGNRIDWSTVDKWVSPETYRALTSMCGPEPGDLLYTAVGATFGRAVLVEAWEPFVFQRHIALLKLLREVILPGYAEPLLNAPSVFAQAKLASRGAAQPTVTLGEMSRFVLPIPPLREQLAIATRVSALLARVDCLAGQRVGFSERCAGLERGVLAKAFRGELVPQEPSDGAAQASPAADTNAYARRRAVRAAERGKRGDAET